MKLLRITSDDDSKHAFSYTRPTMIILFMLPNILISAVMFDRDARTTPSNAVEKGGLNGFIRTPAYYLRRFPAPGDPFSANGVTLYGP